MIKGYKAFKRGARGIYTDGLGKVGRVYWKKGETKTLTGELVMCANGFHFFEHLCFAVNYLESDNVICEVEAVGDVIQDSFKLCTNKLRIIRRVTKIELKKALDDNNNSGHYNSGYYNSGDHNSGYYNSGDRNSGYYNSGYYNSGYYNSGNHNSGHCNSGDYNSGHCNSGHYNSGDYNSGDGYINFFCTKTRYFLFDIEVDAIPTQIRQLPMSWFNLQNTDYKSAWAKCPTEVLDILKSIPEFELSENKAKFKEITGIDL